MTIDSIKPIIGGDRTGELPEFNNPRKEIIRLRTQLEILAEAIKDQNTVHIKVKKLHPDAKLPTKGSEVAACWDVYALEDYILDSFVEMVRTGLAFEVPSNYEIEIRPRSGLSKITRIANSPGTLDSDYRGELLIMLSGIKKNYVTMIHRGDRIAQIKINRVLPVEFEEVEELSPTGRGTKGFGSTGE